MILDGELIKQIRQFQQESFGIVVYTESDKSQISSLLTTSEIPHTIEEITYENETLEKVRTKKYNSRSEALADLDITPLTLDEYKSIKNGKLSEICNAEILSTFTSSAMGVPHIYSFDTEAQLNMSGTKEMFRDGLITDVEWNTRDAGVVIHNAEQFNKMWVDGVNHKLSKINHYRTRKDVVNACLTKDEVDSIQW